MIQINAHRARRLAPRAAGFVGILTAATGC